VRVRTIAISGLACAASGFFIPRPMADFFLMIAAGAGILAILMREQGST
jgi:hypothetical protein